MDKDTILALMAASILSSDWYRHTATGQDVAIKRSVRLAELLWLAVLDRQATTSE